MFECPEVGMGEIVDGGLYAGSFVYTAESLVVDNVDCTGGMEFGDLVEYMGFTTVASEVNNVGGVYVGVECPVGVLKGFYCVWIGVWVHFVYLCVKYTK